MRAFNRVLGLLLGLALAGAGGFMALETILAATGEPFVVIPGGSWLATLRHTQWSATTVIVVMALIAAAGLLLLLAELHRPRRWRVRVAAPGGSGDWWLQRRSVEGHVARVLSTEAEVPRARLHLTPLKRRWRVQVAAGMPPGLVGVAQPGSAGLVAGAAPSTQAPSAPRSAGPGGGSGTRLDPAKLVEEVTRQALARLGGPDACRVKVRLRGRRKAVAAGKRAVT